MLYPRIERCPPPSFDEAVQAIGGHYSLTAERRIQHRGRVLLYWLAVAELDNACCGATGCGYAIVQGYVAEPEPIADPLRGRPDGPPGGPPAADDEARTGAPTAARQVERIDDPALQGEIRAVVEIREEAIGQIVFR